MTLLAPSIVIVNIDCGISADEIAKVAAALTRQCIEHFSPAWGVMAHVRAATAAASPGPGEWRLELRKTPTIDDALGYHDEQPDGTPILYVFPELCAQQGDAWSSCASHEILEALGDPYLHRCVQMDDGSIWDYEVCDRCEADSYDIDGVAVSNFNLPTCFEPPKNRSGVKYDYLGKSSKPNEVRPGGYAQKFDPVTGWKQVGTMRPYRQALADMGLGRATRRAAKGLIA